MNALRYSILAFTTLFLAGCATYRGGPGDTLEGPYDQDPYFSEDLGATPMSEPRPEVVGRHFRSERHAPDMARPRVGF
jgi:hypothetical protein